MVDSSHLLADLHMHSKFSDGAYGIDEIAKCIAEPHNDVIRTVSKTDHDTLLGTEEFIRAMRKIKPERRVIAGTELTAMHTLPHKGDYALHVLVYFYDKDGFDLCERSCGPVKRFFKTIRDDYLDVINDVVVANNHRRVHVLRERCNDYFFSGEERITEADLIEHATSRVVQMIDERSVLDIDDSDVPVSHTDLTRLLAVAGVDGTPEEIGRRYFLRDGDLYVPLEENHYTVRVEDLFGRIKSISEKSAVKAKVGIAHPSTYVRTIAKEIAKQDCRDIDDFYDSRYVLEASIKMAEWVRHLAGEGLIDFVEAEYPRYTRQLPDGSDDSANERYAKYIQNERAFTRDQINRWRVFAKSIDLGVSGGSDTHFRPGITGELGRGFSDITYLDDEVDRLFS